MPSTVPGLSTGTASAVGDIEAGKFFKAIADNAKIDAKLAKFGRDTVANDLI